MEAPSIGYGSVDLISIDQIVSRTKVRLGIKDISDYDAEISLYINEAAATLGTKPTFRKKNCRIEIVCGKATLPKGFKKLWGVRPVMDDCQITLPVNSIWVGQAWNNDLLYLDQVFFDTCSNEITGNCTAFRLNGIYQQQGNQLVFPIPNYFTHAIISYDGYATDCDGILEMHPSYELGFSEYARGMMLDTYNFMWNGEPQLLSQSIQRSFQIWSTQYHVLVGGAFADDWDLNKYMIKRILHGLLQEQNRVNSH